jgi:YHS domain-containing protein
VELSHVAISDFHRIDEIVEAGRQATVRALPRLREAVSTSGEATAGPAAAALHIDPVCRMTVSLRRARATVERDGQIYYFCSLSCRDTFVLHCERYETGTFTRSPIMRPR